MKRDDRAAVLSDLRRIYDGKLTKEVGTIGPPIEWSGRLTVAVAVTPEIDRHHSVFAALGDRFLQIRWHRPGGDESGEAAALRAMQQNPAAMRWALGDAVECVFDGLPTDPITVPEPLLRRLAPLAEFTVRARTHVSRDSSQSKTLQYLPEPEGPTRLAQQFCQLARGSARLAGGVIVNESDVHLVERVALDCIPTLRARVLRALLTPTSSASSLTAEIPAATLSYVREDLVSSDS